LYQEQLNLSYLLSGIRETSIKDLALVFACLFLFLFFGFIWRKCGICVGFEEN